MVVASIALRYQPNKKLRIVGFREYIFTEDSGLVGRSGALSEFTFGTIIQRELHVTLGARLHYGHPDCFDHAFVLTQGGTSKMSKLINVSEDIFGGINVVMRGGSVAYVDYLQVDKGRDVQYDAALSFEGKICGGTSVHTLSRDFFRLMHSPFAFFHKLSLLSGGFGYFFSNLTLVLAILTLCALHAVITMLPTQQQFAVYQDLPSYIPLVNLGFVYLFALIVQYVADRGIKPAMLAVTATLASIPLTLAKMKIHQYYGHRGLALGLAQYVATGRDLATKRAKFKDTFQRYSYSHYGPGLDVAVLLLVTLRYSALGAAWYVQSTLSPWIVCLSWLFAPAIYNPFSFTLNEVGKDFSEWMAWVRSTAFEDAVLGQQAGQVGVGDLKQNNWYSWINAEPIVLKLSHAIARLVIYGAIGISICRRMLDLTAFSSLSVPTTEHIGLQQALSALMVLAIVLGARIKSAVLQMVAIYTLVGVVGATIWISTSDHVDALIQLLLAIYTLGKAATAVLELCVICWSVVARGLVPSEGVVKAVKRKEIGAQINPGGGASSQVLRFDVNGDADTEARAAETVLSWHQSGAGGVSRTARSGKDPAMAARGVTSRSRLLSPRHCPLLMWRPVLAAQRSHAELLGLLHFAFCGIVTAVLSVPLSVVVALLSVLAVVMVSHSSAASSSSSATAAAALGGAADASEHAASIASLTSEPVVLVLLVLLHVIAAHALLGGQLPRERSRFAFSRLRFVWQTLRLASLHNWLVMNLRVARYLAEKDAAEAGPPAGTSHAEAALEIDKLREDNIKLRQRVEQAEAGQVEGSIGVFALDGVSSSASCPAGTAFASDTPSRSRCASHATPTPKPLMASFRRVARHQKMAQMFALDSVMGGEGRDAMVGIQVDAERRGGARIAGDL